MPTAAPASRFHARLTSLRLRLDADQLDAFLVSAPLNISYLVGFTGSAGVLVVARDRAVLVVDSRYLEAAKDQISADAALSGQVEVRLARTDLDGEAAAVLADRQAGTIGIEGTSLTVARYDRLVQRLSAATLVSTERVVEDLRAVKDPDEIVTFREAGRRLGTAAAEIVALPAPGRTEREIAREIERILLDAGFSGLAFDTIVASGPNGALPHARPTDRRLQPGDGVVLDFGGVYEGYCVDLTRTVQLAPTSPAFQRLYDAVAAAQRAAIQAVAPGVLASAVDAAARDVLTAAGLGENFGHGTGHGLGLEVHEAPRLGPRVEGRPDSILTPGMIVTVEPGAYVPGFGGVRIEDDVLVTPSGRDILTAVR